MPKKTKYPGVKARGQSLHFQSTYPDGERLTGPSGLRVGQEKEAYDALQVILRQSRAEKDLLGELTDGELPPDGVTVGVFAKWWNKERRADEATAEAADEDSWKLGGYICPFLGHILISEFRTKHGGDFLKWLKKQVGRRGKLSKRTIRSIWSCLHTMFAAAVFKELLPVNPCVLPEKGENALPTLEDKDDEWRDGAVFERWEIELLISDERIPEWRRVLWALRFFTSFRPGEAAAIPWCDYDTCTEVLGRLTLKKAWNTRHQRLGKTKTKRRRITPVHPTLAKILAKWKLSGWAAYMGRAPEPTALIIPSKVGPYLRVDRTLEMFRDDMAAVGLERLERTQYDLRASFQSIAVSDGASLDTLRWVMWGSKKDVQHGYLRLLREWGSICREVAKLRVELNEGKVLELRSAVGASETVIETVPVILRETSAISRADSGTRTHDLLITNQIQGVRPTQSEHETHRESGGLAVVGHNSPTVENGFTVSLSQKRPDAVLGGLEEAAEVWRASRDAKRLRKRLTALLLALEEDGGEV